jgi:twitching motility protein PilT
MPAIDKLQLNELINQAIKDGAVAIYFNIGNYPVMKINNSLKDLKDRPILTKEFLNTVSNTILPDEQKIILQEKKELTIGYDWSDNVRLSVNFFYQKNSLSVTIKLIPALVKNLNELGLPKVISNIIDFNSGLVVICGPVSAGRTTTALAIIQNINEKYEKRIVTIEEPIEHQFINKKSIIQQREVGRDVDSFVAGLTDVMDEDVSLVYLSRIVKAEEIKMALQVAASGKLVIAVMDNDSAMVVLNKMYSSFKSTEIEWAKSLISGTLKIIVNQRLVKKSGGGLIPVSEIFTMNSSAQSIIKSGKFDQLKSVIQTSRQDGMQDLDISLRDLTNKGLIKPEEAKKNMMNSRNL